MMECMPNDNGDAHDNGSSNEESRASADERYAHTCLDCGRTYSLSWAEHDKVTAGGRFDKCRACWAKFIEEGENILRKLDLSGDLKLETRSFRESARALAHIIP